MILHSNRTMKQSYKRKLILSVVGALLFISGLIIFSLLIRNNLENDSPYRICKDIGVVQEVRNIACLEIDNWNLDKPLQYGVKYYKHELNNDLVVYQRSFSGPMMISSTETFFVQHKHNYIGRFSLQSETPFEGIYYGGKAKIVYEVVEFVKDNYSYSFFIENSENRNNYQRFFFTDYGDGGYNYNPDWKNLIPEGYIITKRIENDKYKIGYYLATDGVNCIQIPSRGQTWNLGEKLPDLQPPGRESPEYLRSEVIYSCDY